MSALSTELTPISTHVRTWEEPLEPGFIFETVRSRIDDCEVFLAESTSANPNVLFELGYAIGRAKPTYQLFDKNFSAPVRIPPLETVADIRYEARDDIARFLSGANFAKANLYEQMLLDRASVQQGTLYFVPARTAPDLNNALLSTCRKSVFEVGTIDTREADYDSLTSQAQSIAQAEIFVTLLLSEEDRNHAETNAQLMLYAGIAAGLGKEFFVLAQEPLRRYLDLGEHIISFESEGEGEFRLTQALRRVVESRVTGRRTPEQRSIRVASDTALDGLFLGSMDARADFSLADYFVPTPEFRQAQRGDRHLFVGSKGSGKTALFEMLMSRLAGQQQIIVAIAPAAFEFPRLASVFEEHVEWARWEFVYHSFWRFIILTEILKEISENFWAHLLRESGTTRGTGTDVTPAARRSEPKRENFATELIRWIDANRDLLYLDFASRASAVLNDIERVVSTGDGRRIEYERFLQHTAMYDIARHIAAFAEDFPIRMLIDDLDRNWSPRGESGNKLIVALLNVIHDLMDELRGSIQPTVFIRRDVFNWLRKNDQEILRRDPGALNWTDEGLEILIARRIAFKSELTESNPEAIWDSIFPEFIGDQTARQFIISRTHRRPRDVIQFCQRAVENAQRAGRSRADLSDINDAWDFAGGRILGQIEAEFAFTYPQITTLALALMDAPAARRWSELSPSLVDTALRLDPCPEWMQEGLDHPEVLLTALYETEIIGVETPGGSQWFESERTLDEVRLAVGDDFTVIVHPAFHRYFRCLGVTPRAGFGQADKDREPQ